MTTYSGLVLLSGTPLRWWRYAEGAPVESGEGTPQPLEGEAVAAIYPASETTVLVGVGAGMPRAQALAVGQRVAADTVLTPPAELHFAAGDHVAVVDRQRFADWMADLAEQGFAPVPVIPAQLVPEAPETGFVRMTVGHETILRGAEIACASDPAIDPVVTVGAPVEDLSSDDLAVTLARAVDAAEVDLRQGAFAPPRAWGASRHFLKTCGILVALMALATVLTPLMLAVRLQASVDSLDRRADDLARTVVAKEELEPRAALERRMTALRGPGLGFGPTASAILSAVKAQKGSSLALLSFDGEGVARATVQAANDADLARIADALGNYGFKVDRGPTSATNGTRRAEFVVRVK